MYRNLLQIYLDKGEKPFQETLKYLFSSKNKQKFNQLFHTTGYDLASDATFRMHNNWCLTNGITYTPAIFINGYEYPDSYEREHLAFFINEVVEDDF